MWWVIHHGGRRSNYTEGATTQKELTGRSWQATRTRLTADQPGAAPRPDVTSVVGEFPVPFRLRPPATQQSPWLWRFTQCWDGGPQDRTHLPRKALIPMIREQRPSSL